MCQISVHQFFVTEDMDTFQSSTYKALQTLNRPIHMEAFQLQKDGMLLLPRLQSRAMRLHADESVFHERFSHVV